MTAHGLWLLPGDEQRLMSVDDFPWFRDAPIGKPTHVAEASHGRFYWPNLDTDIGIETIRHPERFPLAARRRD